MKEKANENKVMKKVKKLICFVDPGHGWCRVRRTDKVFQTVASEVSSFSYQRGDYVYLEEDDDLGLYIKALKDLGYEVKWDIRHTNKSSKIRSYDYYRY